MKDALYQEQMELGDKIYHAIFSNINWKWAEVLQQSIGLWSPVVLSFSLKWLKTLKHLLSEIEIFFFKLPLLFKLLKAQLSIRIPECLYFKHSVRCRCTSPSFYHISFFQVRQARLKSLMSCVWHQTNYRKIMANS